MNKAQRKKYETIKNTMSKALDELDSLHTDLINDPESDPWTCDQTEMLRDQLLEARETLEG